MNAHELALRRPSARLGTLLVSLGLAACGSKELFVGDGMGGAAGGGGDSGAMPASGDASGSTSGGAASGTAGTTSSGGSEAGASDGGGAGSAGANSGGASAGGASAGGIGAGGTGGVDCNCVKGGYAPVCGVDGTTYDAICGIECVPVAVACQGMCPCPGSGGSGSTGGCTGTIAPPADGCSCYRDADCPSDRRCYDQDCATPRPGTCRTPPGNGCFGDADCPVGQFCTGGFPAPCGTTIVDSIGTCAPEACPDGDCDSPGPSCTCRTDSLGHRCVEASGPMASGECRNADGTCSGCRCASPDTLIATPDGMRTIASLAVGDLVYSVERDQILAVPLLRVHRVPASNHHVLRVRFTNGAVFEMSPGHPLADGKQLSTLAPGSVLMGGTVADVERIPYAHTHTYDILPASSSGTYFASGVLVGSTLRHPQPH